jgi:hypothetical protein
MKSKKSNEIAIVLLLIIGIVIGWILNAIILAINQPPKEIIVNKINQLLALTNQGTVNDIIDKGNFYKLIISANGQLSELWVTKDGSILLSNPIYIDSYIAEMARRAAWFECLANSGLKMYGSMDVNETLLQVKLLGGTAYLEKIYIGCEGQAITNCLEKNITQVPTWILGNQSWIGVKTISWIENITGCKY